MLMASFASISYYGYGQLPRVIAQAQAASTPEEERAAAAAAEVAYQAITVGAAALAGIGTEWMIDDGIPLVERMFVQTLEAAGDVLDLDDLAKLLI